MHRSQVQGLRKGKRKREGQELGFAGGVFIFWTPILNLVPLSYSNPALKLASKNPYESRAQKLSGLVCTGS